MTTQAQEFGPHASIKRLADAEWVCPAEVELKKEYAAVRRVAEYMGLVHPENCMCGGTGRIVPFASLREPYPGRYIEHGGWVPPLDVRVACWEVYKALPNRIKRGISNDAFDAPPGTPDTWEETVLRAAEAWLEEQHESSLNESVGTKRGHCYCVSGSNV